MEEHDNTPRGVYILGGIVVVGFVILLIILLSMDTLPRDSNGLLHTLLGTFGGAFTMVISFFFGASLMNFRIKKGRESDLPPQQEEILKRK